MILGHMAIGKYPLYVIWSFHMPFFFIIDGYFWKDIEIKSGAHRKLTIRLLRRLIVPYVLTCILTIFLVLVIDTFRGVDLIPDLRKWILAALYGHGSFSNKTIGNVYPIGGLWFLWALFWGKLLFSFVSNNKFCLPIVIFLFGLGYASSRYVYLPLSFQSGLTCIIFLYLGRNIKEFDLLNKNPLIIIPTLVEVWGIMLISRAGLGMSRNYYANIPSNILGGITGTLLLLYFSYWATFAFIFMSTYYRFKLFILDLAGKCNKS